VCWLIGDGHVWPIASAWLMGSPPGREKLATDARHDQFAFVSQIAVEDDGIRALAQNFWIQADSAGIGLDCRAGSPGTRGPRFHFAERPQDVKG
jgi:hypothetical protein